MVDYIYMLLYVLTCSYIVKIHAAEVNVTLRLQKLFSRVPCSAADNMIDNQHSPRRHACNSNSVTSSATVIIMSIECHEGMSCQKDW